MIKKLYFVAGVIALLLTSVGLSADTNTTNDPATSILLVLNKLEAFSNTEKATSPEQVHDFIRDSILSHFALREMSQWISGPYSQNMSKTEQHEFQQQLEKAFLNIISNNIGSFKTIKSRVKIHPTRYKTDNDAVVEAQIKLYNNTPVNLDLHMRKIASSWKVIDIKANGTSALIYYRHHFMPQLRMYAQKQIDH